MLRYVTEKFSAGRAQALDQSSGSAQGHRALRIAKSGVLLAGAGLMASGHGTVENGAPAARSDSEIRSGSKI